MGRYISAGRKMSARRRGAAVAAALAVASILTVRGYAGGPARLPPVDAPLERARLALLPSERKALMATVAGVNRFAALVDQTQNTRLWPAFVDATHLVQTNLGSIRFFDEANREHRAPGEGPMTEAARLRELRAWTRGFRREVAQAPYSEAHRLVMRDFLRAWDGILRLSAQYPDQHAYDDSRRGLIRIDALLREAWDGQRSPDSQARKSSK